MDQKIIQSKYGIWTQVKCKKKIEGHTNQVRALVINFQNYELISRSDDGKT